MIFECDPVSNTFKKLSEYPQTEYCKLFSEGVRSSFPNLATLLIVKDLTLESNKALEPADFT